MKINDKSSKSSISKLILIIIFLIIFLFVIVPIFLIKKEIDKISKTCAKDCTLGTIGCIKGTQSKTVNKEAGFQVQVNCADNITYNKYQIKKLPDNNILFIVDNINFQNDRSYFSQIFDLKTNKYKHIDGRIYQYTDYLYDKANKFPKDLMFIKENILFNYKKHKFYKLSKKDVNDYNKFINDNNGFLNKKCENKLPDEENLCFGGYFSLNHFWIEDRIHLKRTITSKLKLSIEGNFNYVKDKNNIFILSNKKILLLDTVSKSISELSPFNYAINNPELYIFNNQLIFVKYPDLCIFDLNKRNFTCYNLHYIAVTHQLFDPFGDSVPIMEFLPDGYLFFYEFSQENSLLFDLEFKNLYKIQNLNKDYIKFSRINLDKEKFQQALSLKLGKSTILTYGGLRIFPCDPVCNGVFKGPSGSIDKSLIIFNIEKLSK